LARVLQRHEESIESTGLGWLVGGRLQHDHGPLFRAVPERPAKGYTMTDPRGIESDIREDLVEFVAREIQVRGLTGPAVMFLEASRPYRPLGSQAMLFFDPVLRGFFGGDMAEVQSLLADDSGIERLIERLEEIDEELGLDA
jgi:hypothetical protein